jgi:hypothetical protein
MECHINFQEIAFYNWETCEIPSEAVDIYDAELYTENISSLWLFLTGIISLVG